MDDAPPHQRPRRPARTGLASPLWDVLGFLGSLGLAWAMSWSVRDLIWSLWLSSLVIGYLCLVLGIAAMVRRGCTSAASGFGHALLGAFLFAFFTIHFGGFHLGHSVFLSVFFPLLDVPKGELPVTPRLYALVAASYWPWVLAAAVAERAALAGAWATAPGKEGGALAGFNPVGPYVNVVRMHLLIFFFAGVHVLGLEGFWIFAVVFAVYFFPWRLLRRRRADAEG